MRCSLGFVACGSLVAALMSGCGDQAVNPAWQAMCTTFCGRVLWCFPGASASECRSLCLYEFKGIPCEADPALLDECTDGIEALSCVEIGESELPPVCAHMCTGGLCEGVECDDDNECTDDLCNPVDGSCESESLPDGTPCEGGGCEDGVCTSAFSCSEEGIRAAVATGGGPYTFACDGPTTVTTEAEIFVDKDVILNGEGNLTVDGNDQHRIFSVLSGVMAELHGFTLSGGYAEWSEYEPNGGGAIFNEGTLTIMDCSMSNNSAARPPNLSGEGAAIDNPGTLTLANSTISHNEGGSSVASDGTLMVTHSSVSENSGYGISSGGTLTLIDSAVSANRAGLVNWGGAATLTRVTISGNSGSYQGGGLSNHDTLTATDILVSQNDAEAFGGGIHNSGELVLHNSSVTGNSAQNGGGIYNDLGTATLTALTVSGNNANEGGGVSTHGGTVTVVDSTVSQNSASWRGGGFLLYGEATLINSTVSGNDAQQGGGILAEGGITMVHTTVSRNTAGGGGAIQGFGTLTAAASLIDGDCEIYSTVSDGYNIESPGNTCGFDQVTDQTAEELKLGPLADNGGPTQTHALLPGSVAIDVIPPAACLDADGEPLTEDQRGVARPQGPACDVGAFELGQP
jgi:hypothetical protein